MISRRVLLTAGGAALAGRMVSGEYSPRSLAAARPGARHQAGADTYFAWEEIAQGVRIAWGAGAASMVVSSAGESLLIDTKGYGLGTTLRREVEADGNRLVAVVNTHHHSPQTGSNVAFTADIPVIAHRRAGPRIVAAVEGVVEALNEDPAGDLIANRRRQIANDAHSEAGERQALLDYDALVATVDDIVPGDYGPSEVFEDRHTVRVGDLDVELHHLGRAHTDNDVVVWIPSRRIMHVGNLVYIDAHPVIDALSGGDTRSWQRVLQRAHELSGPEATILPSDGGLIAAAHDFDAQSAYFDQLRSLVQNALDAGMTRQQTVDFIPSTGMGRFANLSEGQRLPVNLGIVYDELGFDQERRADSAAS